MTTKMIPQEHWNPIADCLLLLDLTGNLDAMV